MDVMKILNRILSVALLALLLSSCEQHEESISTFAVDRLEVYATAERSVEVVNVSSPGQLWVAETSASWITISPANGTGDVECQFTINTTQSAEMRETSVRFTNTTTGDTQYVSVTQSGFAKQIIADVTEVELENYAAYGSRTFEVEITTNIDFEVEVEGETTSWIVIPSDFDVALETGYKPQKYTLEVEWKINSVPFERDAVIKFVPLDSTEELTRCDEVYVRQNAGDLIEPTPEGDSLALIAIARGLNCYDWPVERMMLWDGVELWEEGDDGVTDENLGRVKSALFFLAETDEAIPYEVSYLDAVETLIIRSNSNSQLKSLSMNNIWGSLTSLKSLEIMAYGLDELDESLLEIGDHLESLNISSNNFTTIPTMLTPENFPALRELIMLSEQVSYYTDLSNITAEYGTIGLEQDINDLRYLFEWDELECLALGVNYLYGQIPAMDDYSKVYTQEIVDQVDTLSQVLVGMPMVLPHVTELRLNLNRFTGYIPDWILYHPQLVYWDPDTLIFTQEGKTREGVTAGFSNVPDNYDYYYEAYPYLVTE